ncbi:ras-related protein Rab-44 isoform X2 [Balearica regulorum gibbericeps]|uniref:ras-related protein Rab-44 isoform X2 n=1 Tax=Balearica regulorum gibbericeps TaxID=100784 RepID=UPI003F61ABC8
MAERRAATKGRRMGSSRRKQLREGSGKAPAAAPSSGEEPLWASEIMERVQDFLRERGKDQAGFITHSDMQRLQEENFPCSMEELELVFDGLDAAGTGRLSTKEFTAGLWQFLSSQKAARDHRQLKTTSRRVRLVLPSPVLEGVDSEEQRHFAAFMDQLGMDNVYEEQEIWQLWVKLRQDEPQLLGNLEDFLAKMRHRIHEAKSKKEALEVTLNKRVAEHDKEVQQLCEALEQQIQQEQQRLQQESMARTHQHDVELQRALDASEREVQRLVMAQMELEARCRSLCSTQQATSAENQQLEESNRVLEDRLQHLHQQLQQTHRRLRTARAMVAWEHVEESGYGVVAELPSKTPMSPQTSPEKSEKYRSEMRIRLGSQSTEPKAKSIHQVVWEMPPPEISLLGPQPGLSSTEEDPFPEFLKEERFSDQSSLLREMNDAIAALSKQLKPQALGAPPMLAETAHHPRDDAEPQMGPEAAAAHGTTPGVMQETLSSHVGRELFEGDLKEGPATAELHAPDMTQAGASVGARHRRAREPGAEQGESLEEARRMLFLQGKGTGVKELMLKAAEHSEGALGESMEAGEQALVKVEGEGWMQEKIGWEKAQLLVEAKEVALIQGENPEAGFEPPEAGEAGLAAGWQLATDELGLAVAPEECAQRPGAGLGEEADLPLRLSKKLEIKPGERLEPELPSWGEVRLGAAQGDGVLPKVTVASDPAMLEEEHVSAEVQPWGETLDANVLPAPAQHGGSRGAGAKEGEVEVMQPREAELQLRGESLRGDTAWGGSTAGEVPLPLAMPPADVQEGRVGPDVQPLEAQSSDANVQLLAEVETALQPPSEAGSPGTEQGGSMAPGVQPLEEDDKPELGLGEETGAAPVHGEGTSPAETPVWSPDLGGLFPLKAQALQLVEAEDLQADTLLRGGASPETPQGGGDRAAVCLGEEAEDGAQGLGERELPHDPVLHPHRVIIRQGEGAPEGVQPHEKAESLGTLEDQSTDASMQLLVELEKLKLTPGGSTEAALQPPSEAGSLDTEQGGNVAPDVQPLDQADKPELVELVEAEDSWADTLLRGGASPDTLQGGGDHAAVRLGEEAEDGAQGLGEHELPHKPVTALHGAGVGQGEGAGAGVQLWEEAVTLGTLEDRSTDANVQLLAEAEELKSTSGGSTEAELAPLGAAGMQEGEQSQTPGLEGHTTDMWEGAAGAHVSPLPEAALHPQRAAEGPSLEVMLGAFAGQILEDTQTLAILQGERADAEDGSLDGAQGLEGVQGLKLEAGVKILGDIRSLGIKQGHDDGVSELAPLVSKVTLQINTLKLETMMQEDVLIPDVRRLGDSGQAAQNELQEQVSAQAVKVRLHTASQQLEEKPPHVMETECVAAGPAEPPKQEVPPASTLHTRVQPDEDAGNDQSGMVLRDSSLGDAAISNMQPQRQILGEQSKDLNVGQQEKKQEVGRKTSQEGKPSSGQPGAVTADGAGAAPRGSPEAFLDPDHLYNVLFVGDSHVGKTSFLYRLHADTFNPHLNATVGLDYQVKNIVVDNKHFALRLWDSAGQERYHSITKQFFRKADGVVLMYDITSEYSFSDVQYWLSCIQEGAEDGVAILLLGNKTDCAAERRVPTEEGERLAKAHQLMFYECSAASGHNVSEAMVSLIRLLKVHEDELKNKAAEVPKPLQKKKGCCW